MAVRERRASAPLLVKGKLLIGGAGNRLQFSLNYSRRGGGCLASKPVYPVGQKEV